MTNTHRAGDAAAQGPTPRPPKPSYRFVGDAPPPALEHQRDEPRWVAWDYVWRPKTGKWDKPPYDPHTGTFASVSDASTWGTFAEALACMKRRRLAGVGLVLVKGGGISGGDLDDCITDSDSLTPLAAEIIEYGETYTERSPSGQGLRLFMSDEVAQALKDDGIGVEAYSSGRYLTVTGQHWQDTPTELRPAPRTLAKLTAAVDTAREERRPKSKSNGTNGHAHNHTSSAPPTSDDFFAKVKAAALANLDRWVPVLHPAARKYPSGAWRIPAVDLGRHDLEEDLSYHPSGISYFGEESKFTAIDAVQRFGNAANPRAAAFWLCQQLGIEPASLGWRDAAKQAEAGEAQPRTTSPLDVWDGDDGSWIPPREFLLGTTFCRQFTSMVQAPGGVGKTSLRVAQAVALASGKPITGEHVFLQCRVLMVCLEDDINELRRRIRACLLHHKIGDMKGWLFYCAPGRRSGKLMTGEGSSRAQGDLAGYIIDEIKRRKIDVVIVDPLKKAHGVNENSNSDMDEVMDLITSVAVECNVAFDVPHHTSKGASDAGNAEKGRGASASKDAARLVKTLNVMTPEEAKIFGIKAPDDRRSFVRYDYAKENIVPATDAKWFKLVGVRLGNTTERYPNGDNVQAAEPWTPPDAWKGMHTDLSNQILDELQSAWNEGKPYGAENRSERRAWELVADMTEKDEAAAKQIVRDWIKSGVLVKGEYENADHKVRKGLRVDPTKRPG